LKRWEKHGNTSDFILSLLYFFTTATKVLGNLIYPIRSIVEVIEYRIWLDRKFENPIVVRNKKKLLDLIISKSSQTNPKNLTFIEFGVAFGETAKYLSQAVKSNYVYHGFDTFTGLPRAWRKLPQGAFDTGGVPPSINQLNFTFHKGLITETINEVDFSLPGRKVVLFDFDLFEPTLFSLEKISEHLRSGDIVYFDEACDADERIVIQSFFCERFKYKVLGASVFGVAFIID
jgi:hypothetical protein